jgi:hypothetical protein
MDHTYPCLHLTPACDAQVWAWGVVFASLLAKRRVYSGEAGEERLQEELDSDTGVESLVEAAATAWMPERVPEGALKALRWSVCRDRDLRASWGGARSWPSWPGGLGHHHPRHCRRRQRPRRRALRR